MAENVGVHCALSSCRQLDFLPIACLRCRLPFCALHHTPESHDCSVQAAEPVASSSSGPSFASLLPDRPTRDPPKSLTPVEQEKERKKAAALATLARNFPAASTSKAKPATSGPIKSKTRTIEIARLKQRAKPGDPRKDVPASDRLYVVAICSCSAVSPAPTRDLYFSKVCWQCAPRALTTQSASVGKVVDALAAAFNVANVNDTSDASRVRVDLYDDADAAATASRAPKRRIITTSTRPRRQSHRSGHRERRHDLSVARDVAANASSRSRPHPRSSPSAP